VNISLIVQSMKLLGMWKTWVLKRVMIGIDIPTGSTCKTTCTSVHTLERKGLVKNTNYVTTFCKSREYRERRGDASHGKAVRYKR